MELEKNPIPCIGFFTSRRATAQTLEEAFQKIMAGFDADPDMQDIFQTAHDRGLRPKTEMEEAYLIPWWKAMFPWKPPELCFYPPSEDGDSERQEGQIMPSDQRPKSRG